MDDFPDPAEVAAGRHRLLVVSPHLDDAVFSCGRLLAGLPGAVVATVFAGFPPPGAALTAWDRAAGFAAGDDVVGRRREEDRLALARLGAWPLWLDLRDAQYGPSPSVADVAERLRRALVQCQPSTVLFPLGLFHSDHRLCHAAVLALLDRCSGCRWLAYEDALYRRLPGLLEERLAALAGAGRRPRRLPAPASADAAARKRAAVACYRSQLAALAGPGRPDCADLEADEGYWQLERAATGEPS